MVRVTILAVLHNWLSLASSTSAAAFKAEEGYPLCLDRVLAGWDHHPASLSTRTVSSLHMIVCLIHQRSRASLQSLAYS